MSQPRLPPRAQVVLEILKEKGPLCGEEIAAIMHVKSRDVRASLYLLNQRGLLEHTGKMNARWGEDRGRWKAKPT